MNIRLLSKKASLQKAFSTIGFIGVGNMGGFMAKNILTKSAQLASPSPHRVLIFDKLQVVYSLERKFINKSSAVF